MLVAGSLLYLGLVFGVMLWRGIEIEPQWVVLALLVIALALGRGRQFIFDFLPFLLLFFAYEVMRGFASKTGFQPHDLSVLERAVFFGHVPTLVLQAALYHPDRVGWLDLLGIFFYFMHFVLPLAMGFVFWLDSRSYYWRFAAALLVLAFLAFVTYLFFPSTPPWLQFPHEVHKISDETIAKLGVAYFISPVYRHLDPNLYAAFPSLHAAFPTLAAVYAWPRRRRLALALAGWALCVWFSVVYLGEHYVVDALDGVVYVAAAVLLVELAGRRLAAGHPRAAGSGGRRPGQLARLRLGAHPPPPEEANGGHHQQHVAEGDGAEQRERELRRRP
jgi:membrane-associated phospholipid phosphatase